MSKDFEIEGLEEWKGYTYNAVNEAVGNVIEAVDKSGSNIQKNARFKVPVDTGDLRKSITKITDRSHTQPTTEVYTDLEYGDDVELGTYKQRAQPYLFPSLEEEIPNLEKGIRDAIRKELN